ncbi:MAG TPA: hypothetical protein VMZ06_02620 [Candidatus Bathyarchaeia archaeon]|nr:hypothetical protein [Candidatus Bathyarchaeia archaeon]
MKRLAAMALAVVAAFGSMAAIQHRLDAMRSPQPEDELLYLPNEHLLEHFTAGMSGVIADLLWIRCLLYTGKHFRGDHDFTWLNHLCEMTTRLDPYFVDAHRYGGVFLAMLRADDDACIRLLEKGMVNNPDAWELPYEIAMTYLLNRPNQPDSAVQAARYLAMAIKTGKAPPHVLVLAEALQRDYNLLDVEREMWESMRGSDDRLLRDLAEHKLILVELRVACANLGQAADRYAAERGAPPKTVDDLATAGLITALPKDPLGGSFFIDVEGHVQNTSVLDEQVERARTVLRGGLDAFRQKHGRWPANLEELETAGRLDGLPRHPYAGRAWHYDAAKGTVE